MSIRSLWPKALHVTATLHVPTAVFKQLFELLRTCDERSQRPIQPKPLDRKSHRLLLWQWNQSLTRRYE
jgi:hypothetical protein